jgi:hypothetical protein
MPTLWGIFTLFVSASICIPASNNGGLVSSLPKNPACNIILDVDFKTISFTFEPVLMLFATATRANLEPLNQP